MEKSGFFNSTEAVGQSGTYSPTYNADDFSRLYRKTIGNGVLFDDTINDVINGDGEVNGDLVNDLKVSASNNNIIIAEGTAILQGYWYNNDSELQVVTGVTPSENFMIALVLDTTMREIKATKTTWTSGTPAVPEGNENNYVLPLATVSVDSGGAITVTDARQFVTNSMKIVNEINKSLINKLNLIENRYVACHYIGHYLQQVNQYDMNFINDGELNTLIDGTRLYIIFIDYWVELLETISPAYYISFHYNFTLGDDSVIGRYGQSHYIDESAQSFGMKGDSTNRPRIHIQDKITFVTDKKIKSAVTSMRDGVYDIILRRYIRYPTIGKSNYYNVEVFSVGII